MSIVPREVVEQLAERITKDVFDLGREWGRPCKRIEFKVMYDGLERGAGGLCESAFKTYVASSIRALLTQSGNLKGGSDGQ